MKDFEIMTIDNFNLSKREKDALLSYAKNGTFPQTFLVEGATLKERVDFAEFLANMIVCRSNDKKPCGICPACIKCASKSNPDIKHFGEEKENYSFKVEFSRQIKQDAFVIPNDSDKKVYIITEAQNMNEAAENAMLKILEEPPSFDYFILTCSSKNAMLDTVISRADVISLSQQDEPVCEKAVTAACDIALALCSDSEIELLTALSVINSDKNLFLDVTTVLTRIFADALIFKQTEQLSSDYEKTVQTLTNKLSAKRIYGLIEEISTLQTLFKQNSNYNLLITAMCIRLRSAVGK